MISGKARIYALIGPIMLLVIIIVQVAKAYTHDLSTWKGGGFGMFSTIDRPSNRLVRTYLVSDSAKILIEPTIPTSSELIRLRTYPKQEDLDNYAKSLAARQWRVYDTRLLGDAIEAIPLELRANAFSTSFLYGIGSTAVGTDPARVEFRKPAYVAFMASDGGISEGGSTPVYRLVAQSDVAVEIYRMQFDRNTGSIQTVLIAEAIAEQEK